MSAGRASARPANIAVPILSVIKIFENSGYPVVVATGFIPGDPETRSVL